MVEINSTKSIQKSLQKSMELAKCRKCGCMEATLTTMKTGLSKAQDDDSLELLNEVEDSMNKMEPIQYS